MSAINLLPKELTAKGSVIKISKTLKRASVVGLSILIVAAVLITALFFLLSYQNRQTVSRQEELKQSIGVLEQTEQRLILVKDRLDKAELVLGADAATRSVEQLDDLNSILPEGVSLSAATIENGVSKITIFGNSSKVVAEFFSKLLTSDIYSQIELESFAYNPLKGYSVEFKAN